MVRVERRRAPALPRPCLEVYAALLVPVVQMGGDEHLLPVGGKRRMGREVMHFLDILQQSVRHLAQHDLLHGIYEEIPTAHVPLLYTPAGLVGPEIPELIRLHVKERYLVAYAKIHDGVRGEVYQRGCLETVFLSGLAVRFVFGIVGPEEQETAIVSHRLLGEVATLLVEREYAWLQDHAFDA